ncbi:MAG TPA: hypothetical protein V6D17_01290 [Candidatus Obscuribacterales bacterium]
MKKPKKPQCTQELEAYAKENNIAIASRTALKNCGVLYPTKVVPSREENTRRDDDAQAQAPPFEKVAQEYLRSANIDQEPSSSQPCDAVPTLCQQASMSKAETKETQAKKPSAAKKSSEGKKVKAPRKTAVQEFSKPALEDLIASRLLDFTPPAEAASMAPNGSEESNHLKASEGSGLNAVTDTGEPAQMRAGERGKTIELGLRYFFGEAEGKTYTAELRFRAQYAPEQNSAAPQVVPPPAAAHPPMNFTPPQNEAPRILENHAQLNVLDLINERFQALPDAPKNIIHSRQPQIELDCSQSNSKLPAPSTGLAGELNVRKMGKSQRWSKK